MDERVLQADVVVVGAGPGGSAAAYKLAQKGKKVLILEAGKLFKPQDFKRDSAQFLKNLYQDSGQIFAEGGAFFPTMFGKGVGGGTLVNSGISFSPPKSALDRWRSETDFSEMNLENMQPFLDEVYAQVPIEVLSLDRLGRNNTIFKEGLDNLNLKGGVIPRSTAGCVGCAGCFYGCPTGAKQSTDKNFVAKAQGLGAELISEAFVTRIHTRKNKFVALEANIPGERIRVEARHLVLAAGTLGSARILIKNSLANSSGQVGRNFRCHPSVGVLGHFEESIKGFRSVMQGYYCDHFSSEEILLETFWAPAGLISTLLPGIGPSSMELMSQYQNLAGAGGMIREEGSGVLVTNGSKVNLQFHLSERDLKLLTRALYLSAEILLAAGAKAVYADNPRKPIFTGIKDLRSFAIDNPNLGASIILEGNHGMGTCRMGKDPSKSVVDQYGRSHDIDNLWILDSSIFPSALGVNPQITIMALALRGAHHLSENFS